MKPKNLHFHAQRSTRPHMSVARYSYGESDIGVKPIPYRYNEDETEAEPHAVLQTSERMRGPNERNVETYEPNMREFYRLCDYRTCMLSITRRAPGIPSGVRVGSLRGGPNPDSAPCQGSPQLDLFG